MRNASLLLAAIVALSTTFTQAQTATAEKGSRAERKVVDLRITPDPKLPNVLLLGDSISIGYHAGVAELLKGKANVFRPVNPRNGAADNCSDTSKGVSSLDAWLAMQPKWDVIHFNWGLHDIKHVKPGTSEVSTDPTHPSLRTLAEYQANLETIIGKLKATGAKLIYCTTTPVAPETTGPYRRDEDVVKYNTAALKIMAAHGIVIDDLYAFAKPQLDKIQLPKNVHYTTEGSKILAGQVVNAITAQMAK
jgi:acyl-CoA thioesterase-1